MMNRVQPLIFFLFYDTATPEIYTLSLHDALPICPAGRVATGGGIDLQNVLTMAVSSSGPSFAVNNNRLIDRKSTRLNSSHVEISYAVFCLKKKKSLELFCRTTAFYTFLVRRLIMF